MIWRFLHHPDLKPDVIENAFYKRNYLALSSENCQLEFLSIAIEQDKISRETLLYLFKTATPAVMQALLPKIKLADLGQEVLNILLSRDSQLFTGNDSLVFQLLQNEKMTCVIDSNALGKPFSNLKLFIRLFEIGDVELLRKVISHPKSFALVPGNKEFDVIFEMAKTYCKGDKVKEMEEVLMSRVSAMSEVAWMPAKSMLA